MASSIGPKLWDKVPTKIKNSKSLEKYKVQIKMLVRLFFSFALLFVNIKVSNLIFYLFLFICFFLSLTGRSEITLVTFMEKNFLKTFLTVLFFS